MWWSVKVRNLDLRPHLLEFLAGCLSGLFDNSIDSSVDGRSVAQLASSHSFLTLLPARTTVFASGLGPLDGSRTLRRHSSSNWLCIEVKVAAGRFDTGCNLWRHPSLVAIMICNDGLYPSRIVSEQQWTLGWWWSRAIAETPGWVRGSQT